MCDMSLTHDSERAAMRSGERRPQYPATSDEMTTALNPALEEGNLDRIMGVMGEMTRAHRMRRVA